MKERVDEILKRILKLKMEFDSLSYITRDSKFLERHLAKRRMAKNEISNLKDEAIKIQEEGLANLLLSV